MNARLAFCLLALLSGSPVFPVLGDEPLRVPLTLEVALRRATERHPQLEVRRAGERAVEARREQAALRPNPTVEVALENALGTGDLQGVRSLETTVQAQQTLERGGKREKRVAVAGQDRESAARETDVIQTEVLNAAAIAYVTVLAAQQRLELAETPVTLARETLAAVSARVQAGAGATAEVARARVALAMAEAEVARNQSQLHAARTTLATLWGGEPQDVGLLPGRVRTTDALPPEATLRAALDRHARLEWQRSLVAGRRLALTLEQAQTVPDVTVAGGIRFLRAGNDAAFVAGVSMPLLRRNQNQGLIRAARETVNGAEWELRGAERALRAEFSAAWLDLQSALAAAQALRREALPPTDEALALVREAYRSGQLPLIDVLDAQREQIQLRRELLECETAFALALARVDGLTSTTFPHTTALLLSE
jgi:cobalt-zinc-cadmium efflux system outer membrane protein